MKIKIGILKDSFSLLSKKKKYRQLIICGMAIIGSFLELFSVSVVYPLMQVILSPDQLHQNGIIQVFCSFFSIKSSHELITLLIFSLIVLYFIKNAYMIFESWCINRNAFSIREEIVNRLMHQYMRSSYTYFTEHNTAELQRNLTINATGLCLFFQYFMQVIVEVVVCVVLIVYLFVLNPVITSLALILLLGVGVFYFLRSKRVLYEVGTRNQINSKELLKWIAQSIGGIKEIKVLGREAFFENKIQQIIYRMKKDETLYTTLTQIPRYVTECVCMTGVLGAILIQLQTGIELEKLLTQLATFAVAAFRLLPSVGKINGLLGNIQFQTSAIRELCEEIDKLKSEYFPDIYTDDKQSITFKKDIRLDGLTYSYVKGEKILNLVSLVIPKHSSVAFIGESGAGKTTLADLLLGLLKADSGSIYIDQVDIAQNDFWDRKQLFGYIPQSIFLSDDTIKNNVAFGIAENEIDEDRIWNALEQAKLIDFVRELPERLDTLIGENGARISGGQRQRIGIARALYTDPEILIMDEATSALDNETEHAVMESVNALQGRKTMIIIAHRLTTIEQCDIIYKVETKKVIDVTKKFKR